MKLLVVAAMLMAGCATTKSVTPKYASVNGLHMYYEEAGEGAPLVLIHGGGSTAQTTFGAIIPELAQHHRVIAPEQQAHGHTADIDRPLTYVQMADDTATLMQQLGIANADIMGFSNGGMVAMHLALRHPELVRKLVICSAPYSHEGFPQGMFEMLDKVTFEMMPTPLANALTAAAPNKADVPRMFERQVSIVRNFEDLTEAQLGTIQHPALVIAGDKDVMTPAYTAGLARMLPKAKLAIMPGAGHGTYLGAIDMGPAPAELVTASRILIEAFLSEKL